MTLAQLAIPVASLPHQARPKKVTARELPARLVRVRLMATAWAWRTGCCAPYLDGHSHLTGCVPADGLDGVFERGQLPVVVRRAEACPLSPPGESAVLGRRRARTRGHWLS